MKTKEDILELVDKVASQPECYKLDLGYGIKIYKNVDKENEEFLLSIAFNDEHPSVKTLIFEKYDIFSAILDFDTADLLIRREFNL